MKNFFILTLCFCFLLSNAFSQTKGTTMKPAGPKVYALIVGVSEYQYPEMYKPLDYADDDGRAFYKYLVKSNGGAVKPENIDTLFNQQATSTAIMMKLIDIKEKLKEGDLFYFYFSGHGDAYDAELAFLLAYDAPPGRGGKEKNHYLIGSGVLEVYKIKQIFRRITAENVKLVFISDACRTNELAGGTEGKQYVYKRVMEEDAGEIRFTSCASNQKSYEGPQWGGGRGVFSYHFVNGLTGLADEDEDGKVTVEELEDYVSKCVKKDTKEADALVPNQTPQFGCSMEQCDYQILNYVDKAEKEKLIQKLQSAGSNDGLIAARGKGIDLSEEVAKYGKQGEYDEFTKRLKNYRLIGNDGAYESYKKLAADSSLPLPIRKEFNSMLCIYLNNAVNKTIYAYLDGTMKYREYSKEYFLKAYDELSLYKDLSELYPIDKDNVDANLLFLKGHSYFEAERTADLQLGLAYIDSAVKLNPRAAYIYNIKGNYHYYLHQYDKAISSYHKGLSLAPNWVIPMTNLSTLYSLLGQQDSATIYLRNSLVLDSNYVSTYLQFADVFKNHGELDSAIIYLDKGLEKDPFDTRLLCYKGDVLMELDRDDEAAKLYWYSAQLDSTDFGAFSGLLKYHMKYDDINVDSLTHYMTRIIWSDTSKSSTYRYIAKLLVEYEIYDLAKQYYGYAYAMDTLNVETWIGWGDVYKAAGDVDTAKLAYDYALMLDSNYAVIYNRLGNLCSESGDIDGAIDNYLKAYAIDPWSSVFTYGLGYFYEYKEDYANAVVFYEKHLQQFTIEELAVFELVRSCAMIGEVDKAIKYMRMGLDQKNSFFVYAEIKKDKMFKGIKKNAEFKRMMKVLKKSEKENKSK